MKGYALLIGVNEVNKNSYNNNDWEIPSALNDTTQLCTLLSTTIRYEKILSLNNSATNWTNVIETLEDFRKEIDTNIDDSFFFFFYSGHGTPINLDNGTTKEFLTFYDGLVSENEIQEQISLFNEKTKLFVVINSCFSKGIMSPKIIFQKINLATFSFDGQLEQDYPNFQSVYESNREKYNDTIQRYQDKTFDSKANMLFYFASNEFDLVEAGDGVENLNPFTKFFIRSWEHKKLNLAYNYYSFFQILSLKTQNQAETMNLFQRNDSFFSNTFPLIFNNSNMSSPMQTYEDLNKYVSFYFDQTVEEYRMLHSITFNIDPTDKLHNELIARVQKFNDPTLLDDVGVMSLIFVELVDTTGQTNLPHPIRGLKRLAGSLKFGVILTVDDNFNLLHKPKRTQGRVSNKLGGS